MSIWKRWNYTFGFKRSGLKDQELPEVRSEEEGGTSEAQGIFLRWWDYLFNTVTVNTWHYAFVMMVTAAMKLKDACSLKEKFDQHSLHIKNQPHYFANKGPFSQSYGFPGSHVWMWVLDYKESWVPKNWCFWTVVLEKTLESLGLQRHPSSPS